MIEREPTFAGFMNAFDPDGTRVIADITPVRDADGNSPFVVVRHGRFTAVLCLMPFGGDNDHLCIDVHPFVSGQDATAAPFGIEDGRRVELPATGTASHGFPSLHITSVLIGEQSEHEAAPAPLDRTRPHSPALCGNIHACDARNQVWCGSVLISQEAS